ILALIGATPFARRCWIPALLGGLIAVFIFVGISVWVSVNAAGQGATASGWRELFFLLANHLLIQNLWLSFLFPTLVWSALFAWALYLQHIDIQWKCRNCCGVAPNERQ